MVNLRIEQQFARIGLKVVPFEFKLKLKPAQLETKQRPAQIIPEKTPLLIEIDWKAYRESIGYRGLEAQQRQFIENAKLTGDQGIGRRAQEGDALSHLERKISIAQVAANATQPQTRELELVNTEPARFYVRVGTLKWSVQVGGVEGDYTAGSVSTEFRYGKVRSYLEQKPSIEFHALGEVFDSKG